MSDGDGPTRIPPPPGMSARIGDELVEHPGEADSDATDIPFITLPPGILDSATHQMTAARGTRPATRIDASRPERAVSKPARSEIVFFPAPLGSDQASARSETPEPTSVPIWRLSIPESVEPVEVSGALFVGRNPAGTVDHPHAQLLAVIDPAKSVSKTHALFETDAGELYVRDLNSTNGVFVHPPGLDEVQVQPGVRQAVPHGSRVELGDFVVEVERSS